MISHAKRIVFTRHAEEKLLRPGLRRKWVEEAARHPTWTEPDPFDAEVERRFKPIEEFGGRILRVAVVETPAVIRVYKCLLRPRREAQAMIDMTYDPEADAVYISLVGGTIDATEEIAPNVFADRDAKGRILGIEVLTASKVLAPGDWRKARLPGRPATDAAE